MTNVDEEQYSILDLKCALVWNLQEKVCETKTQFFLRLKPNCWNIY